MCKKVRTQGLLITTVVVEQFSQVGRKLSGYSLHFCRNIQKFHLLLKKKEHQIKEKACGKSQQKLLVQRFCLRCQNVFVCCACQQSSCIGSVSI